MNKLKAHIYQNFMLKGILDIIFLYKVMNGFINFIYILQKISLSVPQVRLRETELFYIWFSQNELYSEIIHSKALCIYELVCVLIYVRTSVFNDPWKICELIT